MDQTTQQTNVPFGFNAACPIIAETVNTVADDGSMYRSEVKFRDINGAPLFTFAITLGEGQYELTPTQNVVVR